MSAATSRPTPRSLRSVPRPHLLVGLGPRTAAVLGLTAVLTVLAFAWPLVWSASVHPGSTTQDGHAGDAPLLFAVLLPIVVGVVATQLSERGIDAKVIALLGMLTAVGAALRALGPGAVGLEPGFFVLLLAGRAYGPGFGFLYGTVSMAVSGLLTGGVGPWLPYQMLAAAFVAVGAGLLPPATGRREVALLVAYGMVAALVFGFAMNLWFWPFGAGEGGLGFVPAAGLGTNVAHYLAFYVATSLGWDVPRGVLTAVLLVAVGRPVLVALRRVGRVATFTTATGSAD